jgi:hypothetical protein
MRGRSRDLRGRRDTPVLELLNALILLSGLGPDIPPVRDEHLEARIGGHAGITAGKLFAVIDQVQIEPGIAGDVDHHNVDWMHGEIAEIECATLQTEEIAPQFHTFDVVRSITKTT